MRNQKSLSAAIDIKWTIHPNTPNWAILFHKLNILEKMKQTESTKKLQDSQFGSLEIEN